MKTEEQNIEITDDHIASALCFIARSACPDGDSYGANVENDLFMMHRYCWCDLPDCEWCNGHEDGGHGAPNFHYKPTDLKVWWYKYIGRGMRANRRISFEECTEILSACLTQSKENPSPREG